MRRLHDLQARVRDADAFGVDAGLAALFAAAAVADCLATSTDVGQDRALSALLGAIIFVPLMWRRRAPLLVAVAFAALSLAQIPLETLYPETVPFIALFVLLYTLGRYSAPQTAAVGWVVLFATMVTLAITSQDDRGVQVHQVVWLVALSGAPVLAGRALRSRLRLQQQLRDTTARLEAERVLRSERAVDEERARLASELQAVVADAVSAIVLQAEGVPRVLAEGEPGRAAEAFASIEETGRDALTEMRRLLGVLRRPGDAAALAPQPSLAHVEALVESLRAAGAPVSLQISGERRELPAGIDLAAYRVLWSARAPTAHRRSTLPGA